MWRALQPSPLSLGPRGVLGPPRQLVSSLRLRLPHAALALHPWLCLLVRSEPWKPLPDRPSALLIGTLSSQVGSGHSPGCEEGSLTSGLGSSGLYLPPRSRQRSGPSPQHEAHTPSTSFRCSKAPLVQITGGRWVCTCVTALIPPKLRDPSAKDARWHWLWGQGLLTQLPAHPQLFPLGNTAWMACRAAACLATRLYFLPPPAAV